jgi:hypothetical protein
MSTLAQNHLSSLARQGRHGDTELAHVNPREKAMLKSMGGSGTINPNTGLREYFDPFTIAMGGLTAVNMFTQGRSQEKQAGFSIEAGQQGLEETRKSRDRLGKSVEAQEEVAKQQHGMQLEEYSAKTGISIEDLNKQTSENIRKSGLATSGTIEQKKSVAWDRIVSSFGRGKENLLASLGEKMGKISSFFEEESARLDSQEKNFQRQIDQAKAQQDSWYLGKNIGKFFNV